MMLYRDVIEFACETRGEHVSNLHAWLFWGGEIGRVVDLIHDHLCIYKL